MKFINEMLQTLAIIIILLSSVFVLLKTNYPFPWSASDQLSMEYEQL